jgi:hypothetical protein
MLALAVSRDSNFKTSPKYNIGSIYGKFFDGDQLRQLPVPTSCGEQIIPDLGSISDSVLIYSPAERREIDFAAYDPPEPALSPMEGAHPLSVRYLYSSLKILTRE